jgi:hypothetical protein
MGVGTWEVGDSELSAQSLVIDGSVVSTGAATIEYWRMNGATKEFLQDDLTSFTSTYNTIDCAYNAEHGFGHTLAVPNGAVGYTIHYIIRHSVHGAIGAESNHAVLAEGGQITVALAP